MRQIATNAGAEGSIVVAKVKEMKQDEGFNAATETYEDLVKAGVIDPAKVVRSALQNASSIASLLLTTEALVSEIPEEKKDAAARCRTAAAWAGCTKSFGSFEPFGSFSQGRASMWSPVFFFVSNLFHDAARDPAARVACRVGHVIIRHRVEHDRRAIRVEQRSRACGERDIRFEHLDRKFAIGRHVDVREIAGMRTARGQ